MDGLDLDERMNFETEMGNSRRFQAHELNLEFMPRRDDSRLAQFWRNIIKDKEMVRWWYFTCWRIENGVKPMNIIEALEAVTEVGNEHAKVYAQAALDNWGSLSDSDKECQLLYIRTNFASARSIAATEARQVIKSWLVKNKCG